MATFPTYAKLLADGYAEQRESALLRTEMESGPPKQAKIKSRVMVTRPASILIQSRSDYLSFVDWFVEDLNEGSAWFDFTDPVTNTVKQARFVGGGLEATPHAGLTLWTIPLKIETWG